MKPGGDDGTIGTRSRGWRGDRGESEILGQRKATTMWAEDLVQVRGRT